MQCGNCGRTYSRFSPANNRWCSTDRLLFCAKCSQFRKLRCPVCDKKLSTAAGQLFLLGLIFGIMGAVFMGLFLPTMFSQLAINELPTTSLESLSPSMHGQVKVEGTIAPGQGVVISGYDQDEGSGNYQWQWLTLDNFNLTDNRTTVLVNVAGLANDQNIFGSPQYPPGEPDGVLFESGDHVGLIGTLGSEGNRTVVYASWITDHPPNYYSDPLVLLYITLVFAAPGFAALGTGVYLGNRRLRAHETTLRTSGRAARWKEVPTAPSGEDVEWMPNPNLARMRTISQGCGVGFAVTLALVAGGIYYGVLGGPPGTVGALVAVGLFGALFLGVFWSSYRGYSRKGVARLGLARSGLYVDYPATASQDARRYFPWSDISELSTGPLASSTMLVLKTSFGEEYLANLDRPLIPAVRAAFERSKAPVAPAPTPSAARPLVLRSAGTSAARTDVRLQEEDVVWTPNRLRAQRVRMGAILLVIQVPVAAFFALYVYPLIGLANGVAIFFIPGIWGAIWLWGAYAQVPSRHGLSSGAFHVVQRRGETIVAWADIQELDPGVSWLRIKSKAGFSENLSSLDSSFVQAVVDRFEGFRRAQAGFSIRQLSSNEPADWQTNPLAQGWAVRFYLSFYGPIAAAIVTFFLLGEQLTRSGVGVPWLLAGAFAILPAMGAMAALKTYRPFRYAPTRVGFSRDGVRAEYRGGTGAPFLLREMAWGDVAKLNREGQLQNLISGGWLRPSSTSRYVNFLTRWGSDRMLGPISPQMEEEILLRVPPGARQDWKEAWDLEVGRRPVPLSRAGP